MILLWRVQHRVVRVRRQVWVDKWQLFQVIHLVDGHSEFCDISKKVRFFRHAHLDLYGMPPAEHFCFTFLSRIPNRF